MVECGNLSHPDNGMVSLSGIVLDSVATYTCDTGYDLVGNNDRTCLATGNWSGNEPTCIEGKYNFIVVTTTTTHCVWWIVLSPSQHPTLTTSVTVHLGDLASNVVCVSHDF